MPLHKRSSPAAVAVWELTAPTDTGKDTPSVDLARGICEVALGDSPGMNTRGKLKAHLASPRGSRKSPGATAKSPIAKAKGAKSPKIKKGWVSSKVRATGKSAGKAARIAGKSMLTAVGMMGEMSAGITQGLAGTGGIPIIAAASHAGARRHL